MIDRTSTPRGPLRGQRRMPGDKSVSHRAILLHALARGPARVRGLSSSDDVTRTAVACRALGVRIEADDGAWILDPPPRLNEPSEVIDCGNSGTSMRLLAGVLAARSFHSVLTGDASLRRRPMLRVVEPLRRMGAHLDGREGGRFAPLAIRGGALCPILCDLPIPSAQVKSAVLLAGLTCGVAVREPRASRDHTERMLRAMGATLSEEDGWLRVAPIEHLDPVDVDVPGDLSAAAFLLVAAALVPGSELLLEDVGINPSRSGVLDVLAAMGADLQVHPRTAAGPEPRADIVVRHRPLVGTRIAGDTALRALDELPILAVAAAFAQGETRIADASELRVKESDRIARMCAGLRALGVEVEEHADGMTIGGGRPRGPATVDASGDHRIAMAFTIAGLAAEGGVTVTPADVVTTSWPDFYRDLNALTQGRGA